jgi:ATP-binding cassette subfamily F protein uup
MDTLDMLEEILIQYKGTLIVVSHDRDFLDQTVTKTLAFEGNGKIISCVGGYSDYLEKKNQQDTPVQKSEPTKKKETQPVQQSVEKKPSVKLSYKLERELNQLPDKIKSVETTIAELNESLSDGDYYNRDPEGFHETVKNLQDAQTKLERYETRWLELAEMKEGTA